VQGALLSAATGRGDRSATRKSEDGASGPLRQRDGRSTTARQDGGGVQVHRVSRRSEVAGPVGPTSESLLERNMCPQRLVNSLTRRHSDQNPRRRVPFAELAHPYYSPRVIADAPPTPWCAALARALDEPLPGTAPVAPRWACLEHRGTWPDDVTAHRDDAVRAFLTRADPGSVAAGPPTGAQPHGRTDPRLPHRHRSPGVADHRPARRRPGRARGDRPTRTGPATAR
jgi:hypothetical protein